MLRRGHFITIEGLDGAGKSTNVELIEHLLQQQNIDYITTREPGGTHLGEKIRELVLHSQDEIDAQAELLLIFAARAQHIKSVIEPALLNGVTVLSDRFTDATYAYQGGGRGLNFTLIKQLEMIVTHDLQPDLTFLLDIPIEVGTQRAGQRSTPDRFESEKMAFKQKVRDSYLTLAEKNSQRIKLIDANQTPEKVAKQIQQNLDYFLKQLNS